jgi:hypothetical protein
VGVGSTYGPVSVPSGAAPEFVNRPESLLQARGASRGKQARAVAPLDSQAEFAPGQSRDPVGLLLDQAKLRVWELVPVRHGRMPVSPFTF